MGITYVDAGVDQATKDKAVDSILQMARRTHGPGVIDVPWGFAGFFSLKSSPLFEKAYRHPVLVACTDGVGTKLKLAKALGKHDTVGIDLVAMSVNDMIVTGATPLFFLDYIGIGKTDDALLRAIVKGIVDGCLQSSCALLGGETAELPGMYAVGEYDLAGFAVGVVEKSKILTGSDVKLGDEVIAIGSSGLHSNGYSLARKIAEASGTAYDQLVPELGGKLGQVMLTPTKIYVKAVRAVLRKYKVKKAVKAMANITGGGIVENLPRVLPKGLAAELREGSWPVPPIFEWLRKHGDVATDEMRRVFNLGVGMVMIVSKTSANAILRTLKQAGEKAWPVGRIVRGSQEVRFTPS